jgi:TetR/AcrR family transcriptional repressor of nem operon
MAMLDFYIEPYVGYAKSADQVCLCGALAGEILALPPQLRSRVDGFFRAHQAWLTGILKRGMARGEFELPAPASKVARLVFGALQGALLVRRTTGDASQLRDVVAVIKLQLRAGS